MIYDATKCALGEGPLWHPARKQLFWFDILGKRLHTTDHCWDFDTYVSAAGWIDHDTLIVASAKGLHRFDIKTGDHSLLCHLENDNPVTRSNDGRADPQGGFWIGTMGINAEMGAGSIYRYYKGCVRNLYTNLQITNSICFAPAGDTAFFTDTNTQMIMSVALDADGSCTSTCVAQIFAPTARSATRKATSFRHSGASVASLSTTDVATSLRPSPCPRSNPPAPHSAVTICKPSIAHPPPSGVTGPTTARHSTSKPPILDKPSTA